MRPTLGSFTPSGNETPLNLELTMFSASAISGAKLKRGNKDGEVSLEMDWIVSRPSIPAIASSMGIVTFQLLIPDWKKGKRWKP